MKSNKLIDEYLWKKGRKPFDKIEKEFPLNVTQQPLFLSDRFFKFKYFWQKLTCLCERLELQYTALWQHKVECLALGQYTEVLHLVRCICAVTTGRYR